MTQTSARPLLLSPSAALAPLSRHDLPSFVVGLLSRQIVEATPACAALGLAVGGDAPVAVRRVVEGLSRTPPKAPGFARLRLPGSLVPRLFRYLPVLLPSGPAVLFADPDALESEPAPAKMQPLRSGAEALLRVRVGPRQTLGAPVRISFETDAQDRLLRLSPQFVEALGARAPAFLGNTFDDLEAGGLLLSNGALAVAMASGGSFSDVAVEVPGIGPDEPLLELELGGIPLLDPARRRRAVRGFGLLRSHGQPVRPPKAAQPGAALSSALPASPLLPDTSGYSETALRRAENVVSLRGGSLSPQERSAFREIASTLAAAIEDWPKANSALAALDADDADAPMDALAAGDAPEAMEMGLLDRLPVGLLIQQDGELTYANRALLVLAGWSDLAALKDTGGLERILEREPSGALSLLTREGQRMPVEVRLVAAPFMSRPALLHVIRPIELDDARESRAVARREALDMVPCPVFLLENEGAIRLANRAAAERFGFEALDLAGEPFTVAVSPEDRAAAIAAFDRARNAEAPEQVVLSLRDRAGETFPGRVGIGRAGGDQQLLCVVVSPAAIATSEPDRLPRLAQRMMESLDGPISTALAFAERHATTEDVFPADVRSALSTLRNALSDLAALAGPSAAMEHASCDLAALVRATIAGAVPAAHRRRLALRSDLPDALSATTSAPHLARLVRVMIEEAIEATPAGGTVAVSLFREEDAGGRICLQVCDGGPAVDEVARASALSPLDTTAATDRFSAAGRPLRAARLTAEAEAVGGAFTLRPDLARGMIARLTLS